MSKRVHERRTWDYGTANPGESHQKWPKPSAAAAGAAFADQETDSITTPHDSATEFPADSALVSNAHLNQRDGVGRRI